MALADHKVQAGNVEVNEHVAQVAARLLHRAGVTAAGFSLGNGTPEIRTIQLHAGGAGDTHPAERVKIVYRDAYRKAGIDGFAQDGLANPVSGVGQEAVALQRIEPLNRSKQSQNAVLEVILLGQAAMGEQLRNSAGHQVDKTGGLAHEDLLGALITLLCQYAELLVGHRPKLLGGKVAAAERSGLSAAGHSGAGIH